jgi:hypothetical protein
MEEIEKNFPVRSLAGVAAGGEHCFAEAEVSCFLSGCVAVGVHQVGRQPPRKYPMPGVIRRGICQGFGGRGKGAIDGEKMRIR